MEFRTQIDVKSLGFGFEYGSRALFVGSCFAVNMAERMVAAKFEVECNPFGVLYNPMSIAGMLHRAASGEHYVSDDLVACAGGDLWANFDFHGSFSDVDRERALVRMNEAVDRAHKVLAASDMVVITFGTAWVYELANGGRVVSNCHKFPASTFRRRRMTVCEIVDLYDNLLSGVLRGKHVVFTVSPIRHIKDGLAENSVSKSTLRVAVEELAERHEAVSYFPAFEIMNDDLRDYRFYTEDMVHPSSVAVDYIWAKFSGVLFDKATQTTMERIAKVVRASQHRPFNPDTPSHRRFVEATIAEMERIETECVGVSFARERELMKSVI